MVVVGSTDGSQLPLLGFALVDIFHMSSGGSGFSTTFGLTRGAKMASLVSELGLQIGDGVGRFGSSVNVFNHDGVVVGIGLGGRLGRFLHGWL